MDLIEIKAGDFRPHLNTTFSAATAAGDLAILLIEVSLLPGGDDRSFSLAFRQDEGPSLTQGTYELRHHSMGELALFLVPIQPDDEGCSLYESIFNRMTPEST